jgi:hypothetical protein
MNADKVANAIVVKFKSLIYAAPEVALELLQADIADAIEDGMIRTKWAIENALGDADYDETGVEVNEEAMAMIYDTPLPDIPGWVLPNNEEVTQ